MKKRITVTMSEEFFNILNARAEFLGTSIPAVLLFYALQGINQEQAISSLDEVIKVYKENEKNNLEK